MSRLRTVLKYAAVACAAAALAYGVRAWEHAVNDVTVIYQGAPPGALVVELFDDDGDRVRRTEFGAGAERRHDIQLPRGRFDVRLRVDEARSTRDFTVSGDGTIELKW